MKRTKVCGNNYYFILYFTNYKLNIKSTIFNYIPTCEWNWLQIIAIITHLCMSKKKKKTKIKSTKNNWKKEK